MTYHVEQRGETDRLNALADRLEIPARIESRCAPLTEEMLEVIRRSRKTDEVNREPEA